MMILNWSNIRDVLIALVILLAAVLIIEGIAHAQFGGPSVITVPGSVTSDQPTETAVGDLDATQLPADITQNTYSANSLTTGGGTGYYTPINQYLSGLDQSLFSGINGQNFQSSFPGFVPLPADSTDTVLKPLTTTLLTTYGQALALAQSQEQELDGESFLPIESANQYSGAVLTAIHANTEAVLAEAQEMQYVRQLLATLITVEATKAAEELNTKTREAATTATWFNLGVSP